MAADSSQTSGGSTPDTPPPPSEWTGGSGGVGSSAAAVVAALADQNSSVSTPTVTVLPAVPGQPQSVIITGLLPGIPIILPIVTTAPVGSGLGPYLTPPVSSSYGVLMDPNLSDDKFVGGNPSRFLGD